MLLYVVFYSKKQQTQQASACRDRTGRGSRRAGLDVPGVELGNRVGAPAPGGLGRLQAGESGDGRQDQADFMGRWPARRPPRPLEKGRTKGVIRLSCAGRWLDARNVCR